MHKESVMSSGFCRRVISALMLPLLATCFALAQSTTQGGIGGTVYDQHGAVVPNATIVAHNNGTNSESATTTDASGYYRFSQLQPAVYTLTITASGFAPYRNTNVTVNVGSLTDVSPRLAIGSTAETVDVTAEAPQINTTSAEFAPTVNQTDKIGRGHA